MNIHELQSTQHKERQKSSLQHLDDSFYQDAGEYLDDLYEERDQLAETVDDPFSSHEIQELTDTIESAEQIVESLYERRTGKIVKAASFEAAGMASDIEATTDEEQELFESLVDELEANRAVVLETLERGSGEDEEEDEVEEAEDTAEDDVVEEDETVSGESGDESEAEDEDEGFDVPRTTVQITADVGAIFGVDGREYDLQEEDVVTLPKQNAAPLLEKGGAKPLD